jgi:ATPase subunit of ABC transporter with duplicated ATPase domains
VLQKKVARLKEVLPDLPPAVRSIKIQLPEPARSGDILITARGITKSFGSLKVINNLNFAIRRGERIALLGPNGVGKSTLIKLTHWGARAGLGSSRMEPNESARLLLTGV